MTQFFEKLLNFLSSLRLAVFVILALAVLSAVGTIYEAKYDAEYAQRVVYHSKYMYAVMILLSINLIFVMVDRWPWKQKHIGFLMAHVGIITTLVGAYITQHFGVDGSMAFPIGEKNRYVNVSGREIIVYTAFAGGEPRRVYLQPTDFFDHPPEKEPFVIDLGEDKLEVTQYYHYALRSEKFERSDLPNAGPAIRFQLQNSRVNLTEWIQLPKGKTSEGIDLGPARVVLSDGSFKYESGNLIHLRPLQGEELEYVVYLDRKNGEVGRGKIKPGEGVPTGWMDLQLRILNYYPKALKEVSYEERESPTKLTSSAIALKFEGNTHWIGLNSLLKLFSDDKVYYVTYGNRRLDVGFDLHLVDFRVGRYQGTRRAMTYESDVMVPEKGKVTISMNNPLKQGGFTFYQASFEEDEKGLPTVSVLSVNKDPGRFLKYLGSFMIVFGSILLFYFRRLEILSYLKGLSKDGE